MFFIRKHPNVGSNTCVVEHVGRQADDGLQQVVLQHVAADLALATTGAAGKQRRAVQDNADARLTEKGREIGLVDDIRWQAFSEKQEAIEIELQRLRNQWINPTSVNASEINALLKTPMQRESTLEAMIRRPEVSYEGLMSIAGLGPAIENTQAAEQVEIKIKYQGYIDRQLEEIEKLASKEGYKAKDGSGTKARDRKPAPAKRKEKAAE